MIKMRSLGFRRTGSKECLEIIKGFNCTIRKGEFVSLVGPSGCGKSTLVALISGALTPTQGTINFPSGIPRLGVQFQTDALFPWRRVWANLGYALEISGHSKEARRAHASRLCDLVDLNPTTFLDRYPAELSGGECRRVSLAMAISANPDFLLVDEATGNLDWMTRRNMQRMLQSICTERKLTTLAVTHDVEEAVWLSDRIIVMRKGGQTEELPIDLPRPRSDVTRMTSIFTESVAKVGAYLSETTGGICSNVQ
jgi:ABC-type nitrate/sulfonate/bicarbonate transport system ATPase subunit